MIVLIRLLISAVVGGGPLDDQPAGVISAGAMPEKLWGEGLFTEGVRRRRTGRSYTRTSATGS